MKINYFGSNGLYWYWVVTREGFTNHIVQQIVKHGGGSFMVLEMNECNLIY